MVPGLRSQHFGHILPKPKLQLMASLSSNHSLDLYLLKSLGPLVKKIDRGSVYEMEDRTIVTDMEKRGVYEMD